MKSMMDISMEAYDTGIADGVSSRDAEVAELKLRIFVLARDEYQKRLILEQERDKLREQVKLLRDSLASVLATRKAEAIASMTLDNSEENFTDSHIEEAAFLKAANAASNAEKLATEALAATEQKPKG